MMVSFTFVNISLDYETATKSKFNTWNQVLIFYLLFVMEYNEYCIWSNWTIACPSMVQLFVRLGHWV